MNKEILENGVRFLYKYNEGEHTSFCIGIDAGANKEDENNIGVAHALEHILFKGTKNYTEDYINKKLDEIFAMNNAMTNFPYVIYYGVTANDDFKQGFDLYSDIILNPSFKEKGFEEEISIIKEESREWSEELEQHCEDLLLENTLVNERISKKIIGNEKDIANISIKKLKRFYNDFYVSENISICVVTSLSYDTVKEIVCKNFSELKKYDVKCNKFKREKFLAGDYRCDVVNTDSSKIQRIYDISRLEISDITLLRIFNMYLGEGVSSILYDEIRTKRGIAYEVYSEVKFEKGISLFKIVINTSKKHRDKAIEVLNNIENNMDSILRMLTCEVVQNLIKRYKLKLSLDIERSIVIANRSCIYDIMFNEHDYIFKELKIESKIDIEYMKKIIKDVLKNKSTMILE